ncbi:hypothetical protein D3C85_1346690 [compost metagenome]
MEAREGKGRRLGRSRQTGCYRPILLKKAEPSRHASKRPKNDRQKRCYAKNLKQIGSGTASDFNVSGLLSQAEFAEGLFQHNRPKAAGQKQLIRVRKINLSPFVVGRHVGAGNPLRRHDHSPTEPGDSRPVSALTALVRRRFFRPGVHQQHWPGRAGAARGGE